MRATTRAGISAMFVTAVLLGGQLIPATALADNTQPQQELHNITYRARVDGVSRGALISYNTTNSQVQTANPTMLPGRTFEANTVLPDPQQAGMQVSIQWPYSANLHCEILVDDATTAQADQFIAPRFLPQHNDPDYGVLSCGAPLNGSGTGATGTGPGNVVNTNPVAPAEPAPAEPAPPPAS